MYIIFNTAITLVVIYLAINISIGIYLIQYYRSTKSAISALENVSYFEKTHPNLTLLMNSSSYIPNVVFILILTYLITLILN